MIYRQSENNFDLAKYLNITQSLYMTKSIVLVNTKSRRSYALCVEYMCNIAVDFWKRRFNLKKQTDRRILGY